VLKLQSEPLTFEGHLAVEAHDDPHFVARIQYAPFDPTTLAVDLHWLGAGGAERVGSALIARGGKNYVWLYALDESELQVEVLGIRGITARERDTSINASAVQIGLTRTPLETDLRYVLSVQLQPSGILIHPGIHEYSFTGEISVDRRDERPVHVESTVGQLRAMELYRHYATSEYGDEVTHSVRRAAIGGELLVRAGENLFDFNERLRAELDAICAVLSLCYRQLVDYYEVEYLPIDQGPDQPRRRRATVRRRHERAREKIRQDELIHIDALADGGLDRLVARIRSDPAAEIINRAIRFLAASYEQNTEAAFFMAFSAMEAVVECCVPPALTRVVGSAAWRKIEHELRKVLDDLAPETTVEMMKSKLPELRRAALPDRMKGACAAYGPPIDDLWPEKVGFAAGLAAAIGMRNGLFHSADVPDSYDLGANLVRIRTLTERLLLKRLGWPDDKRWVWYDQNLKWINTGG
jgi:hypothetical protein